VSVWNSQGDTPGFLGFVPDSHVCDSDSELAVVVGSPDEEVEVLHQSDVVIPATGKVEHGEWFLAGLS